jgi:TRAP-type C4-dicarboxylate transport system substrate-binding protein
MSTTVPRPRLLPAVGKFFREGAFSDRLGVRNEGSLEPLGPSFFGRNFDACVHRNKRGRYHKQTSNYQTRESPDEGGLICRNVSPNILIKNSLTEISMLTRRNVLVTALAAPAILRFGTGTARAATTLKISHQFPGGTIDKGDFRDRLCRVFAAEVAKRSGGEIAAEIYPNSSLIKTNAQFSAMRKGALDVSLYPLPYAGGELPETNIGLMPGLVSTYDQGLRWKNQPVGKALTNFLADKGIVILTWIWQAGGVASRSRPLVAPEDAKGLKVRGGSREMDMVLQTAGAAVLSLPSNELYAAMQTGACDAGLTSSTSLISFRLEEVAKHLTSGAGASYWFMLEPLLMSKSIFDKLPKNQQDIIRAVGTELEAFGKKGAQDDDIEVAKVYEKAGAKVSPLDAATVGKWRDIARDTAWKDYAGKTAAAANLLKLASDVSA